MKITLKQNRTKAFLLILLGFLFSFGTGCATSRSVVDIPISPGTNPLRGVAVKIVSITDTRSFEAAPNARPIPSLINDVNIRSRAIGRKHNTYLLLPEGKTVQIVIREAITRALRDRGYSVVDKESADYEKAMPLQVDIRQLWAHVTPGFWSTKFEFETVVFVQGDPFLTSKGEQLQGYAALSARTGARSNWIKVIQKGMDDFIDKLKEKLRRPTRY